MFSPNLTILITILQEFGPNNEPPARVRCSGSGTVPWLGRGWIARICLSIRSEATMATEAT